MSRSLALRVAVFGCALAAARVEAQTAADRRTLLLFRDSIQAVSDQDALRQLEARLMLAAKKDRTNAARHLSLGFLALRLAEWSDAAAEFKWATQLEPQWPLGWIGLGRAELAQGRAADTTRLGRRALLSQDAWARATQAFARGLLLDPGFASDLVDLAGSAVRDSSAAEARVIRDGLRRAATGNRLRSPAVPLGLGQVELTLGDTTAALAAFAQATELPGGKGPGLLAQARARLGRGDRRGVEVYFDAAGTDDSSTIAGIRADLDWIASSEELAEFDRTSGRERAQLLWQFWLRRDRRDLRQTGERLAEHYHRLALVAVKYPGVDDDRARVFVRHGEPHAKVAGEVAGIGPNESWWYRRPDGELTAHFASSPQRGSPYHLVESLFDLAPEPAATSPAGDEQGPVLGERAELLLRSRAQLSPFYQSGAASRRDQIAGFRARERAHSRRCFNQLLTTDRFPLEFERELAARYQLLSLADSSGPALHLFFSIPGFATGATTPAGAGVEYPVRVRLVVWDSAGQSAQALDSMLSIRAPGPIAAGDAIGGHLAFPMPAGVYSAQFAIESAGNGVLGQRPEFRLGGVTGEIGLTDLLLAGSAGAVPVDSAVRDRGRVDPRAVFSRLDTLEVAATALGRLTGPVRVRALFRPEATRNNTSPKWRPFPGQDDWLDLTATGTNWLPLSVSVPLKGLKIGGYEVELVVVDDQGRTARNRARFEVEDQKPRGR